MLKGEVWKTYNCDILTKDSFMVNSGDLWLNVVSNSCFIGLVRLSNYNNYTLELHPYLLAEHKAKCREVINEVFKLFLTFPSFINKLIATIPFSRKIVYNLAKKTGFQDEGINRKSILIDGVYLDQWNVGITKEEVKEILWVD